MPKRLFASLPVFLPLFIVLSGICLLILLVIHQQIRQNATDVLYVSGEAMVNIVKTQDNLVVNGKMTDLASYPQVYIMTFNQNKTLVSSTTTHNGKPVVFPTGVFDQVSNTPYSLNWAPEKKLRQAVLIYKTNKPAGYVVMGRSLKVYEERSEQVVKTILPFWLLLSIGTFITTLFFTPLPKKKG